LKYINKEYGLHIIVEEVLINALYDSSLSHYPNEFGGLLVGNYSLDKNTVFINKTILPSEYTSSRFSFIRGTRGLRRILKNYFKMKPSQYYVGEWHSHPDGLAVPSGTDLNAFIKITSHDEVYIDNPILLIFSVYSTKFDFSFYVYFNQKFLKYEKE